MEERKQNKARLSDQPVQRVGLGAKGGMQTFMGITENSLTAIDQEMDSLLENILSPSNLNQAYKQVRRNRGSGGIDKMEVEDLLPYLRQHKDELIESIYAGNIIPIPYAV
jgi:retron-type reverse transcriptase